MSHGPLGNCRGGKKVAAIRVNEAAQSGEKESFTLRRGWPENGSGQYADE